MPSALHQRRSRSRGQSLVEAAILLPALIIITLGGTSLNSYVQAQSQLNQAVSRAALVAARSAYDPCLPGDAPGATTLPATSNGQPHGYQDVVDAFNSALTSPLFALSNNYKLVITCTSEDGTVSVTTTTTNGGGPPTISGTSSIPNWTGWASLSPGAWAGGGPCTAGSPTPADNGCFAIWRGGLVTVSYTSTLQIHWTPFWHSLTIGGSAGEQIEPFRNHVCPNAPANGGPAC